MKINIIGAGMMGSAMSVPATDNGHSVRIIGSPLDDKIIDALKDNAFHITLKRQLDEGIEFLRYSELTDEVLNDCDILISGVSSFGVPFFASEIITRLKSSAKVLAITKGLYKKEDGSLISLPQYFKSIRDDVSFNAVGGPCISFELCDRVDTEVAFCGESEDDLSFLKDAFKTSYYHITKTTDIIGIETAVALKNAYAMAVSLAIGKYTQNELLKPEKYNAQAGLFYEASREMSSIIKMLGGKEEALFFGVGDLYVTVFGGRTRRLGVILGSGVRFSEAQKILSGQTLESVAIIKLLGDALKEKLGSLPLLNHIHTLITTDAVTDVDYSKFVIE